MATIRTGFYGCRMKDEFVISFSSVIQARRRLKSTEGSPNEDTKPGNGGAD